MADSLPKAPSGRVSSLVVAGLIALATSILAPIIVRWYTDRIAVELQLIAQSTLVDETRGLTKLQATYDKQPLSSLSRIELNLVNVGRKSIRGDEVISPIIVAIDSGSILDVRSEQELPLPQQITFEVDANRKWVTVRAPLLNPGDGTRFTLLIDRTPPPAVRASARIVGLQSIRLVDRRPGLDSVWSSLAWSTYVAWLGVVVALLGLIFYSYLAGYTHRTRHVWRIRPGFPNSSPTPEQYANTLTLTFGDNPTLAAVVNPVLGSLAAGRSIPKQQLDELNRLVEKYVRDTRVWGYRIMVVLFTLVLVGALYVLYAIVTAARTLSA